MALSRTLEELRDEVSERADLHNAEIQIGEDALDRAINAALKRLYRLLCSVNTDFYLTSATVTIASGEGDLPFDFWRAHGVEADAGSGDWRSLKRWSWSERNRFSSSSPSDLWACGYRAIGSKLRLFPATASGSVRLWYIPAPTPLENPADTFDGIAGFEDFLVVDAAIRIKQRLEEDVSALLLDRKELLEEIASSASERDDAEPDRVRDVDAEEFDEFEQIVRAST